MGKCLWKNTLRPDLALPYEKDAPAPSYGSNAPSAAVSSVDVPVADEPSAVVQSADELTADLPGAVLPVADKPSAVVPSADEASKYLPSADVPIESGVVVPGAPPKGK